VTHLDLLTFFSPRWSRAAAAGFSIRRGVGCLDVGDTSRVFIERYLDLGDGLPAVAVVGGFRDAADLI